MGINFCVEVFINYVGNAGKFRKKNKTYHCIMEWTCVQAAVCTKVDNREGKDFNSLVLLH